MIEALRHTPSFTLKHELATVIRVRVDFVPADPEHPYPEGRIDRTLVAETVCRWVGDHGEFELGEAECWACEMNGGYTPAEAIDLGLPTYHYVWAHDDRGGPPPFLARSISYPIGARPL